MLDIGEREINQENFPLSKCSMKPILSEALEKYLKVNKTQIKVSNKTDSFDFIGNERLMRQVLFYLLDNAVFSIKSFFVIVSL